MPNMRFYTFPLKSVPKLTRRKSRRIREDLIPGLNCDLETELCYFRPSWKNFTLEELKDATDNFSNGSSRAALYSFQRKKKMLLMELFFFLDLLQKFTFDPCNGISSSVFRIVSGHLTAVST